MESGDGKPKSRQGTIFGPRCRWRIEGVMPQYEVDVRHKKRLVD